MLKACIKVLPMVEEYARTVKLRQNATEQLLGMIESKESKRTLVGIGTMLGAEDIDFAADDLDLPRAGQQDEDEEGDEEEEEGDYDDDGERSPGGTLKDE